jgi:predicted porin
LYGSLDAGIAYDNNSGGHPRWAFNQGNMQPDRWGLRGSEDLGGGLKGIFKIESGFGATKGRTNGDALFNRRAYVGLQDNAWGTLTLGKNQPIADALWALDPTGQQFIGSATLVRGRNWQGNNNMVMYETPKWGGFSAQVLTSLGEQAGSFSKLRKDAVALTYTAPSFELRAIYDVARDGNGKYSDIFNTSKELTLGGT